MARPSQKCVSQIEYDGPRLQVLQRTLCTRLEDLFDRLEVNVEKVGRRYTGCCPVHGGDNISALSLYEDGEVPGKWSCYTRHCEAKYKKTIIGFVRGVLSYEAGRDVGFPKTVEWCCQFLGVKFRDLVAENEDIEKFTFTNQVASLTRQPKKQQGAQLTRSQLRDRLVYPADYFVKRGWSPEVLDRYDVGYCDDPKKAFFERVVVPVYDESYRTVIGYTARSVHGQCPKCKHWHRAGRPCPVTRQELAASCKWRNSESLDRESHLYNWWFAGKHIRDSRVAVLVEGCGEVWRLEEADVHVGLGLFGNRLTDEQQVRLETSGAMTVICLLNNDEAGKTGAEEIRQKLSRCYRLVFPSIPTNDLGDLPANAVKEIVQPLIEQHRRIF